MLMFVMSMCLNQPIDILLDRAFPLHAENYSYPHSRQSVTLYNIPSIYLIDLLLMNPDCYSDIKLAERFFFENSIYLLNMFEKKLDSFINSKPKKVRERERAELFHVSNIIDPDARNEDPIRILSKDLTKPIWHCVTKTDPVVVCIKNGKQGDAPVMVTAMNDLFACFLLRLKHEHEDESNLRIGMAMTDRSCRMEDFANRDSDTKVWPRLQELLKVLEKVREKYERDIKGLKQRGEENQFMEVYLQWSKLMFQEATIDQKREDLSAEEMRIPAQLYHFVSVVCKNMEDVIESAQGPTLINYWPDLHYLPDLIHPMLMAIYVIIRGQLSGDRSRQSTNASVSNSQQHIQEESNCVFQELPERNFSKITFINLDGHDSPFNLTIAKSLSRYLQYVSFPCDEGEALTQQPYAHYFDNYSEFLVKHYVHSELTEEERLLQHRLFKTKNKTDKELTDYYRQLLVFPVYSRYLSQRYELASAQFYQSKFIKFIMKQLVLIQVREFNPSLVVISLSHRLHIQPDFYQELMKELTIIGNMRLVLYHNLTRSYMFQGVLPQRLLACQEAFDCHRLYARTFDRPSALITNDQINLTILHKTAVFLKIASGTHSLQRAVQEDNVTEKYDIFRVQKYAGTLVKLIGKSHPVLERFKNRFNQYLRLERLLTTMYDNDKNTSNSEDSSYPLFHRALLDLAKTMIQEILKGQTQMWQGFMKGLSREYIDAEWDKFALRYRLEVKKEREEEEYKYITRLRREKPNEQTQNKGDFIALQFEIVRNGVSYLVNLGKQSQICIDPLSQSKVPLVYLFNHLFDNRETILRSYCGQVTQTIQDTYQTKVRLTELQIPWIPQHPFQNLTRFNYLQTTTAVLLFWPTLYDQAKAIAYRFMHAEYQPTITNLIFAADRSAPHRLIQVQPVNPSYLQVIPRSGCTCYQVPSTNMVYIFGGFYGNKEDYLNFQTDITVARLGQQLEVSTIPKNFYFQYESTKPAETDLPYRITRLSSDFVRPRIQYEVYPLQGGEDLENLRILLVGGVGERFLRPYSMIGYMAHHLTFTKEGILQSVRRIRLHNVVPVNLRRPIKTRTAIQVPAVHGAQNRQLYLKKTGVGVGNAVFSWFQLKYEKDNEKMTYKHGGDLALLPQNKEERPENTITIRQNNSQVTARALLRHYSSLKEVDNKLALVYQYGGPVEQSGSLIFSLQLQLSQEVYQHFVNLSSRQVPLTGSHLVALDTLGLQVFAVLRHEEFTRGRCVLAYCDIGGSVQALVQGTQRKIILREVYRFDGDMRGCTVKAMADRRIAIVHGFPMHPGARIPECVLKRTSRGHFIRQEVYNQHPTYALNTFLTEQLYHSTPLSFFLATKHGLACWSFRSCSRGMGEEEYYFLIEELNAHQETKRWRLKTQKTVRFEKTSISISEFSLCVTTILDIRVTSQRKYELFLLQGGRVYIGSFDAHLQSSSNTMSFREYERPLQQYEMEKYRQRYNVEYLQKLTKYPQMYVDALEEMEAEKMMA